MFLSFFPVAAIRHVNPPLLLPCSRPAARLRGWAEGHHEGPGQTIDRETLTEKHLGDLQGSLRAQAGVFTGRRSNQPGIEVNLRGLSGYGRVNAMIDGVPQNFRNTAGHSSSGGNLLYVHPELLARVGISKGAVSGAHGMGTLAGAVNFRTLSADDILQEGRNSGVLGRLTLGTNGANASSMLGFAHRFTDLGQNEGQLSLLGAVAYTSEGNYETGNGNKLGDAYSSKNRPKGGLFKVSYTPDAAHRFDLNMNWYENKFMNSNYKWNVRSQNYSAQYRYTPGNDWVNLDVQAFFSDTDLKYLEGSGTYSGRHTVSQTYGINLSNTAHLSIAGTPVTWTTGGAWQRDDFDPRYKRGSNHPGELDKSSLFTDVNVDFGRLGLISGLRYDAYRLNGYRPSYVGGDCPAGQTCGDHWAKRNGGKWLPKIGANFDLTPHWRLSGVYAHTFRPPTTHEVFYAGAPFGDAKGSGLNNNPHLKPEESKGWDFALTYDKQGLLRHDDRSVLRIGYFNHRISHYIVSDMAALPGGGSTIMWVNSDDKARMSGWEIQGGYDMGVFYTQLSYTHSRTDSQPTGLGTGLGNGEGSVLPDTYWTLDIGGRMFDQRLQMGAMIRYVGEGKEARADMMGPAKWETTDSYHLVDLYGHYQLNKQVRLYWNVDNLFDKAYGYAGSSLSGYQAETGRGRTYRAGVEARF